MKIKVKKIKIPWYAPREETDPEFLEELTKSFQEMGQLDDIIVRRNTEGDYELISGSQRLAASKNLGWEEIDAKVLDVSDEEAAILALESNIVRRQLQEIEEGKAIQKMIEKFKLTQKQVAERLRRSDSWVSQRLSLALDVVRDVQNAISRGEISVTQAVIIGQLPANKQTEFLNIVLQKEKELRKKLSAEETRLELKRFQNDTIFTIGYQGVEFKEFIEKLNQNNIEAVVDIRESGAGSLYKPEFSKKVLGDRLTEAGLKYIDRSDLGVPYEIREVVMHGWSPECFEKWYRIWNVKAQGTDKVQELAQELKDLGRSVLLCAEQYPIARGDQKHNCHRDILAILLLKSKIFIKRTDI